MPKLTSGNNSAPFLLRDPTLSHVHIAFSYGSNIWIANRNGHALRRLTSAGQEGKPALSPDGEHIAFIGGYGGPRGVFVMRVAGGEPWRVTHHPDDLGTVNCGNRAGDTLGWMPDGKRILFSSRRAAFAGGVTPIVQLFTVPLEGGPATPLPLVRAAQGAFSPDDARRIAYVPHAPWQFEWKRYRGGQTTPIWIADLTDSSIDATIPRENSNDFNPMWVSNSIFFLSDRNGPVTLFSYDLKSQQVRQILKNDGFDIKCASVSSQTIVYEQFGSLHLLDLRSGDDHVLDIRPRGDFPEVRPHVKVLADIVGADADYPKMAPKISPTGTHAVFEVRGDIFTVPVEGGDIRNVTRTPDVVERDPAWSPDGKSIAYFSDETGEYALHVLEATGLPQVRKFDLGLPPSFYYSPTWSPDGRKIGYTDKRLNYWYADLDQGTAVRVDQGLRVDPSHLPQDAACRLPMAWSPDCRWLAYIKILENYRHAVFVLSIEQNQSYQLTDGMSDVLHLAFDKAGECLYFTASTEVGLTGEWLSMSNYGRAVRRSVYAVSLNGPALIDPDGFAKRIVCLPIPPRNYSGLFAGQAGFLFLLDAPVDQPFACRTKQVHRVDVGRQKTEQILDDIIYFDVSFNGAKLLYARQQDKKRQWFVAPAESPMDGSGQAGQFRLNFESMEVYIDPRAEWRHLFEQVWRVQRDFLYDPGLHGLDLDEIKKTYRPFLENIVNRDDLYYLFAEMLSNLTVGHLWTTSFENFHHPRAKTGLLGADYSVDRGRYRFARIYESDPWSPATRSPLSEPGRSVAVGEYLLTVDGCDVRPSVEVFKYFEHTAGRQVVLTVGPEPDGTGSRAVTVVPLYDEYPLRYFAWIEGNRREVDALSGGRVAYVHVPDCMRSGYAIFTRYFFAQVGKEAAVIDNRYNNGGCLPDYIIDCLKRPLMCYWHMREGQDVPAPALSIFGPKVMLINEMACSMGETLPWMFSKTALGPLIGKRTWGGLVGFYTYADDLLDHGVLSDPNLAFYTPEGEWEVENRGVSPDIEVEEDPRAARDGHDAQLEKAVDVVMQLLSKNPVASRPRRPPYPRYNRET